MSMFLKIFISIMISAGIAGGGMFYVMQKQIDKVRSENQSKTEELTKQIATLKSSTGSTSSSTATTSSETTNWKTYTNSTYKFNFKYPSILSSISDKLPTSLQTDISPSGNLEVYSDDKTLQVWANPAGFGLEDATDFYTGEIKNGKITITKKEQNSEAATSNGSARVVVGLMQYNSIGYIIAYGYHQNDRTASLAEFDTILSTFNFTN